MDIMKILLPGVLYIVLIYGMYICWKAYRVNRKFAWRILVFYYFYTFISLCFIDFMVILPENLRQKHIRNNKSAVNNTNNKTPYKRKANSFPFMQILLVGALSLLAKEEAKTKEKDSDRQPEMS